MYVFLSTYLGRQFLCARIYIYIHTHIYIHIYTYIYTIYIINALCFCVCVWWCQDLVVLYQEI